MWWEENIKKTLKLSQTLFVFRKKKKDTKLVETEQNDTYTWHKIRLQIFDYNIFKREVKDFEQP